MRFAVVDEFDLFELQPLGGGVTPDSLKDGGGKERWSYWNLCGI